MFLFNSKHDVDILTHQGNNKKKLKECLYRLGIRKRYEYNKIIKAKGKKIDYEFNIIVDDNPFLINDLNLHSDKYLLLYDSPWNHSYDCNLYKNIFRVHNFNEVSEKIEQLENIIHK